MRHKPVKKTSFPTWEREEEKFANPYARRAVALSERGLSAEQILQKLGEPFSIPGENISASWGTMKENKRRLEGAIRRGLGEG